MNGYRGKHAPSVPWAVSSTASSHYRSRHQLRNRRRRRLIIAAMILLLFLLVLPFTEVMFIRVDRANLTSEDLPADIGRLRVVFLSDIHYGFFFPDGRVSFADFPDLRPAVQGHTFQRNGPASLRLSASARGSSPA